MFTLYDEQSDAVNALQGVPGQTSLNLSDTGTGKTLMYLELVRRRETTPLVIVPRAGISQFRRTAELQQVPLLDVINIEKLKTGRTPWLRRNTSGKLKYSWLLPRGAEICIDEAHQFGGRNSDNQELLALLRAYDVRVHLMSATMAQDPLRLRATGFLLNLHRYDEKSFYDWCRDHGCYWDDYKGRWQFDQTANRVYQLQRVHALLKPYSVRLRKEDIKGFPECETTATLVNLQDRDTEEIQRLYAEMRDVVRTCDAATAEVELLRRRQRAEHLKAGVLADMVEEIVEEGRSTVVFTCFRDTLESLAGLLEERGIGHVKIMGGDSQSHRDNAQRLFQANLTPVCLAMIQAGGVSINLHDLEGRPREALICPDWNPVHTMQCLGRIHRAGGISKAVQRFVLAANTVEEEVYRGVIRKLGNMKTINDGLAQELCLDLEKGATT